MTAMEVRAVRRPMEATAAVKVAAVRVAVKPASTASATATGKCRIARSSQQEERQRHHNTESLHDPSQADNRSAEQSYNGLAESLSASSVELKGGPRPTTRIVLRCGRTAAVFTFAG
jgi:hypothetical protein